MYNLLILVLVIVSVTSTIHMHTVSISIALLTPRSYCWTIQTLTYINGNANKDS